MAYKTIQRYGKKRRAMSGLGDLSSIIAGISTAGDVASDPYFGEVVCRIGQLKSIESGGAPGDCVATPAGQPGGVGLANLMYPLRAYVFAEANKWVYPVAALAILGLPMWIGYRLGKP
jgi:hypothetical protein